MAKYNLQSINSFIKKNHIEIIDLKAIDLNGRLQHISSPVHSGIMNKLLKEGVGFDGSSYGYAKVENSDMVLIPDLETAVIDPFRETKTLSFYTHIHLTDKQRSPFNQDARYLAKKTELLLKDLLGIDKTWWGPEFEFYIFSDVEYDTRTASSYYHVKHAEEFHKRAYHAANPFDIYDDFRDEASQYFKSYGINVKYHHHEVGERGQQEIETYFSDLITTGDNVISAKYILFNLARKHNLFVTFMPKPMYKQAGNGLHLHTYLTKNGKNAFYKKGEYANINELGRCYIGGILKHGKALSAFTNPSTNSYKRLVPGFEAPVALSYGQGNRTSAIRIPKYITNPKETRIEYRPPDATANPYFAMTAITLAGIDGIINKIDPVKEGFGPLDQNYLDVKDRKINYLPRDFEEALEALEKDNDFLLRGNIFTKDLLTQWENIKHEEIRAIGTMPHPFEYKMYFTL